MRAEGHVLFIEQVRHGDGCLDELGRELHIVYFCEDIEVGYIDSVVVGE